MLNLHNKTALVTGASGGIGRAVAERLARDGALVAVHYGNRPEGAMETIAMIERAGGRAFAVHADLGVDGALDALFTALDERLKGAPLDIVVNNAASAPAGPLEKDTAACFDRMFAVNVKAPYFIIQRALSRMPDGGRIINISSVSTRVAVPAQTSFAMSKGALEVMGRTLAHALGGRGITVNTVTPGTTRHESNSAVFAGAEAFFASWTALGRLGRAADVADAVAFLASKDARWITGTVLDVSGGIFLGPPLDNASAAAA